MFRSPTSPRSPRAGSLPSPSTGLGARTALILVTLFIALPTPWSNLWGGQPQGSASPVLLIALCWTGLTLLLSRLLQQADTEKQEAWSGALLVSDVLALTLMLLFSGAAQNPFSMLYFVPITLATVVARKWTWRIALLSVLMFALLLARTAHLLAPHANHPHHAHFFHHVQGMAIALAVAGAFITYFVLGFARSLSEQQSRIEELSRAQEQDRYAVALGTLSAGAAHEIGSPLGTVQLLAEELPHLSPEEAQEASATIVSEVQRIKSIVHQMSSSELSADLLSQAVQWSLSELQNELEEKDELRLDANELTTQPQSVLRQILRELLRNAHRADPERGATVSLYSRKNGLQLSVEDRGPGMAPEQLRRATEAFISHHGGTGLGLFLVSVHARQLGGHFELRSAPGQGCRAQLSLPLAPRLQNAPLHQADNAATAGSVSSKEPGT